MKRALFAAFLVLAMLVAVACQPAVTPTTEPTAAPTEPGATPTEYVRGPVTMTVAGVQIDDTSGFPEGQTLEDNVWLTYYKEELDVTIVNKWVVPQAQYNEKMTAQIGAGDVPDLMKIDTGLFQLLIENDLAEDLTAAYDATANEWLKAFAEMDNGIGLQCATRDETLYAMPYYNDAVYTSSFWIRKDWLDKFALPVPKTMEDVYNAAKKFVEEDPDGNSQKDTMGLGLWMNTSINQVEAVMTGFSAYPSMWVEGDGGKAVLSATTANAKKALEWLNRMYAEGLIPAEFATMTDAQVAAEIVNGKCGITTWPFWAAYWSLQNSKLADPAADWISVYPTETGADAKLPTAKKIGLYFAVRKGFEHPEIVFEMANKFAEATLGPNKMEDTLKYIVGLDGGNYWQFAQVYFWPPINQDVEPFNEALAKKDKSLCPPFRLGNWNALEYMESGKNDAWQYASYLSFGPTSQYMQNIALLKKGSVEDGLYFGAGTPTMAQVGGDLDKILLQGYAKIIAGDAGTTFEGVVADWLAAGGQTITDEVNAELGR